MLLPPRSPIDEILNMGDERLGQELLTWWIALVADQHNLDPNDSSNQVNIVIQTRAMDGEQLSHAGLEKAIKRAAQGEFTKAGEMFRALTAIDVDKLIDHRNNHIAFNTVVTVGSHFVGLHETKKKQDKQRVENRQDQVDRRAFQAAVKANIDDYATKADAIRDLIIKPQFAKYKESALQKWLTPDVWTKPKQIGRPKQK